jgi:hypothetical protein
MHTFLCSASPQLPPLRHHFEMLKMYFKVRAFNSHALLAKPQSVLSRGWRNVPRPLIEYLRSPRSRTGTQKCPKTYRLSFVSALRDKKASTVCLQRWVSSRKNRVYTFCRAAAYRGREKQCTSQKLLAVSTSLRSREERKMIFLNPSFA